MESRAYIVKRIEGEYSYLSVENDENEDELFIALALLPQGIDIGTRLVYENFEFKII